MAVFPAKNPLKTAKNHSKTPFSCVFCAKTHFFALKTTKNHHFYTKMAVFYIKNTSKIQKTP
jgi:L-lysine 2,3-aminomutase